MSDVASRAGVGIATVDRVLNGRRRVRGENAQRVYEAAAELGYHATPVIQYRLRKETPRVRFGFVLPKGRQAFYRELSEALKAAVEACPLVRGSAVIRFAETQNPREYVELLASMAGVADVVAASAVSHNAVARAVEELDDRGIPTFAMLNDFAQNARRNFIGLDNYRVGRLAGWLFANTIAEPGTIAVFVGGNLWQAHQQRESGLRSYFRERAPQFHIRDAGLNLETRQVTYEMVLDTLSTCADLRGLYVTGGGIEGAIQALRESVEPGAVKVVAHPLTDETRLSLEDGYLTMVIGTPIGRLADELVMRMANARLETASDNQAQVILKPDILLPEYC